MHNLRYTFFLLIVSLHLVASPSQARDWFVNPEIGKKENDGSQGFPLSRIQDAIDQANPQDRILLFPPQAIYRQSVTLSKDQAGLVIEGNGVTLSGADPLPKDQWKSRDNDLHRIRVSLPKEKAVLLLKGGTLLRQADSPEANGQYPEMSELSEGQYRFDRINGRRGWLTWKGTPPEDLSIIVRSTGVESSGNARNVKFFNLGVRHFLKDGFYIHGNSRGLQFINIEARENRRDGFRARNSASCIIQQGRFHGNKRAISDGDETDSYYEDCIFEESLAQEVNFQGGRHSLTRCEIKPGPESEALVVQPHRTKGTEISPTSLVLREINLNTSLAQNRTWTVGAGSTVFVDLPSSNQLSLLALTKHPTARISEELYRVEPIGRMSDGSPIMTWVGGGTGSPRPGNYRIIHFDKHAPSEVAAQISPENDWFGLMSPLPTADFPPTGPAFTPENEAAHAIWRWIGLTAPNAIFLPETPEGLALAEALRSNAPAGVGMVDVFLSSPDEDGRTVTSVVTRDDEESTAKAEMIRRLDRTPREVFDSLSPHYGNSFNGSYIEALALIAKMRASGTTKAVAHAESYLEKPLPTNGGTMAGTLLYAEIQTDWAKQRLLDVANLGFDGEKPKESMPFHHEMSDAVFMGGPILARAGVISEEKRYFDQCVRHIQFIQEKCLRSDGLYRHSPLNEAAWGRGNGFPALGLAMVLDHFPKDHPARSGLETDFVELLDALARHQDPNGMWHQIINLPDSYAEFTSTCMIAYAIARGIDNGTLNSQIWNSRLLAAWTAIKARISSDGATLYNVCESTGKQKTLEAYYRRKAILGPDPRGGAMALLLSGEMIRRFEKENH